MERTEVRLRRADWYNGAEIAVVSGDSIAVDVTMEKIEEGMMLGPVLRIDDTAAQVLMDDLWQAGFRPTEGSGSAGSLRATERHLEDMRKIVGKKTGVEL